jgi:hypothetical protein
MSRRSSRWMCWSVSSRGLCSVRVAYYSVTSSRTMSAKDQYVPHILLMIIHLLTKSSNPSSVPLNSARVSVSMLSIFLERKPHPCRPS